MASWIVDGEPELDLWKMDIRRFGAQYRSQAYTLARTVEVYQQYYDIHYPNEERQSGRPLRLSPAYGRLAELGAAFGEKSGWERPNWFTPNEAAGRRAPGGRAAGPASTGRPRSARRRWRPARPPACSTSRASPRSRSPGRAPRRSWAGCAPTMSTARSARSSTPRCSTGGAGSRPTSRSPAWPADRFLIVTGTAFGNHDLGWIRKQLDDDAAAHGRVLVNDLTSAMACFGLWGPNARAILGDGHPRRPQRRRLSVPDGAPDHRRQRAPVLALRVTYVGELGWELYPPSEYGASLWDALWTAGAPHGLVAGGYRAIDALRLEKGYRVWSSDITPDETPWEAGPRLRGPAGRDGRPAARVHRAGGPRRGQGGRAPQATALPRPRRSALGLPGQRAGPDRRRRSSDG